MAVAVKNAPETAATRPLNPLVLASWLGVAYVLGSLGIVFYGLPTLWHATLGSSLDGLSFVNNALLAVAMLAAGILLVWGGTQLFTERPRGWAAGVAVGVVGVVVIALVTAGIGTLLESSFHLGAAIGLPVTLAVGAVLLFVLARSYTRPGFEKGLLALEDQGWFNLAAYKKTQGLRVRRGTMLAVLAIAGCGIWTLMDHKTLEYVSNWEITLPYADGAKVILLRDLRYSVPILLAVVSLWFAYRLVHFPAFADFLIATEAELNKVSWATRKRLVQDTIVVLTTVVLVTAFIFFVDIFWGWSLEKVGVIQMPPPKTSDAKEAPW